MKWFISFFISFMILEGELQAQHPFLKDSLYKTIYAKDLCKMAHSNPDLLLVDVRSPGEYSDTSHYNSLNLGHLKGAINLDIEEIKKDMSIINQYKNRTIVLYCSHSQRSRRVSELLAENGFNDFYNLNGGMSSLIQLNKQEFPCKKEWIESSLPYKNLSNTEAKSLLKKNELIVIDVRPAMEFNSTDSIVTNNIGHIKGAINIPYTEFNQRIKELDKYKENPILIYTAADGEAARAAVALTDQGFLKVYRLTESFRNFEASSGDAAAFSENMPAYTLVNGQRSITMLKKNKQLIVCDTRNDDAYNNKLTGRISYMNLGRIQGAIHVTENMFQSYTLTVDKQAPVLIYGMEESVKYANILAAKGYKHVYLLSSLYDLIWSSFNINACKDGKQFLVNHEELY